MLSNCETGGNVCIERVGGTAVKWRVRVRVMAIKLAV